MTHYCEIKRAKNWYSLNKNNSINYVHLNFTPTIYVQKNKSEKASGFQLYF